MCVTLGSGPRECPVYPAGVNPWVVTITPPLPPAPRLLTPDANAVDGTGMPHFIWQGLDSSVPGSSFRYQIQADNSSSFSHPELDINYGDWDYFMPTPFADGVYSWRVRAVNFYGVAGKWSAAHKFTVDTIAPPAPVRLSPVDYATVNTGRPAFKWAKTAGASSYRLWGTNSDGDLIEKDHLTGTSYTPTASEALAADQYDWYVDAYDAAGHVSSPTDAFHLTIVEDMPSGIPATPQLSSPDDNFKTNFAPTFDWNLPPSLPGEIQISNDAVFQNVLWTASFNAGDFEKSWDWVDPPLTNGKYYWRVRFYNAATLVSGLWSKTRSFLYNTTPPAAPALLAPAGDALLTNRRPTFKWSGVPGAMSYSPAVKINGEYVAGIPSVKKTSYTPSSDLPFGDGYWYIIAFDAYGNDVYSLTPNLTICLQNSPAPDAVTTNSTITFKWAAFPGAASYALQVIKVSGEAPLGLIVNQAALPGTSYTASGLTPGKYRWAVSASGAAFGPPSNYYFYIKAATPAAPTLLGPANKLVTNNPMQLAAHWNNDAAVAAYEVQVSGWANFASLLLPPLDLAGIVPDPAPVTGFPLPPTCPATTMPPPTTPYTCYWRVRGVNAAGITGKWSTVRSYLFDAIPPAIPTPLFPESGGLVTNSQLTLRWSSVADAVSYEIRFDTASDFSHDPHATRLGKVTSYKLPTTLGQGPYFWTVQAYAAAGNPSGWYKPTQTFTLLSGQSVPKTPTPTTTPTPEPSLTPVTGEPTPSETATAEPTVEPSATPSPEEPTIEPSSTPAPEEPTAEPTIEPGAAPTEEPMLAPTDPPAPPDPSATPEP